MPTQSHPQTWKTEKYAGVILKTDREGVGRREHEEERRGGVLLVGRAT